MESDGQLVLNSKGDVELVFVPGGEFTMGDEELTEAGPARRVYLDAYWIGRNVVTVSQFRAYCENSGYGYDWEGKCPKWGWTDSYPMVFVTWDEARAFCLWAGGDLPTEAQWEKAARGPEGRLYPWGNHWDPDKLCCSRKEFGDALGPSPVGSRPVGASPFGCLDMVGNVNQWCLDWYGAYDSGELRNPIGADPGGWDQRVYRGGCWADCDAQSFLCASRFGSKITLARNGPSYGAGFRLVVPAS